MFSTAFMDVITDGLLINQQKLDPKHGSEDLQLLAWISYSVGGIIFTVIGGVFLQKYDVTYVFYMISGVGVALLISGIMLDFSIEKSSEKVLNMGLGERIKFNYQAVRKSLG